MILKCASCGDLIEFADDLPEGQHIRCPSCGVKLELSFQSAGGQTLKIIQDRSASDHAKFHVRRATRMEPYTAITKLEQKNPPQSGAPKNKSMDWALYIFLVIGIVGFGVYLMHRSRMPMEEELMSVERCDTNNVQGIESERDRHLSERHAEEDFERERRRRKTEIEDAEREKRRAEKEKREADREKERQELLKKADLERRHRELISTAEMGFNGATSVFASDFPSGLRPFDFTEDGTITVADEDYVGGGLLYKLTVKNKKITSVQRISQRIGTEDVGATDFLRTISNKIVLAKMESGPVWICGNTKMNELIDIPESADVYAPLADFMSGTLPVLNALHIVPPAIKYRVTLKAKKNKGEIKLGIVEKEIDLQSIRSRIRERIADRKLKRAGIGLKPPKMKKVKRTVMMYDGEIMKKEISGITKIPREPKLSAGYAYQKWEELRREAERQDQEELEAEAENQRRMEEYRRKTDAALRDAKPTEAEVDTELSLYRLLIERSRTKLKAAD